MNQADTEMLIKQARIDGKKLFVVSEAICNFIITINCLIGIFGIFAIFLSVSEGVYGIWFGLAGLIILSFFCTFIYVTVVLSTYIAKVLVHTSFACIALVERKDEL